MKSALRIYQTLPGVLGLLASLALVSCQSRDAMAEARWWSREARRIAVENEVKLARLRAEAMETEEKEWTSARSRLRVAQQKLESLTQLKATLEAGILAQENTNEAWLEDRLAAIRASHKGSSVEFIQSNSGKHYQDVEITQVSEAGVEFRHATGLARLTARQLTMEQLRDFGIDADRSRQLVTRERQTAALYAEKVEEMIASTNQREMERRLEAQREEARQLKARIDFGNRELAAISTSPLAEPPRRLSSSRPSTTFYTYGRRRYSSCYSTYRSNPCLTDTIYGACSTPVYPLTHPSGRTSVGRYRYSPNIGCRTPRVTPPRPIYPVFSRY